MSDSPPRGAPRTNNLLALGSAAVLTVYAAGFARTKAAAQRLEAGSDARRRPPATEPRRDAGATGGTLTASSPASPSPSGPTVAASPGGINASLAPAAPTVDPLASAAATAAPPGTRQAATAGVSPAGATPSTPATSAPASSAPASSAAAAVLPSGAPPASATSAVATSSVATAAPTAPAPLAAAPTAPANPPASAPGTSTSSGSPAPGATAPAAPADSAVHSGRLHDGTFTGWGSSRHGDIEATVVVENGKITGAIISRCLTRYSCSWIAHLQAQVVARQSPEVDNVSGATQSANAFYYAVIDALAKAK